MQIFSSELLNRFPTLISHFSFKQCFAISVGQAFACGTHYFYVIMSWILVQQQDVQMHSFENATCSHYKRDNWAQLRKILERQELELPEDSILGTMEGKIGAGVDLLEILYETLNQKKCAPLAT